MSKFIQEIRKDSGEAYQIDSITAFAFSLQKVLKETGRQVDILRNEKFVPFLEAMNAAMDVSVNTVVLNPTPRNEEDDLWNSNQLGLENAETLTLTLTSIVIKHLKIRSSQGHRELEMSCFKKFKILNPKNPTQIIEIYRFTSKQAQESAQSLFNSLTASFAAGSTNTTAALLQQQTIQAGLHQANKQIEIYPNLENPARCPVRILDFYIDKRPLAVKTSGPFYLWPIEQARIPIEYAWFKIKPLSKKYLLKCLFKIKQTNLEISD